VKRLHANACRSRLGNATRNKSDGVDLDSTDRAKVYASPVRPVAMVYALLGLARQILRRI